MPVDRDRLRTLVEEIGRFYVTDRHMRRAQERMDRALSEGDPGPPEVDEYIAAVKRYFFGFEREAREHLADVELRLAKVSQVQFNLTAERGVAARRVSATQGVLSRIEELAGR